MTLSPERLQEIRDQAFKPHGAGLIGFSERQLEMQEVLVYADAEHARAEKAERERDEAVHGYEVLDGIREQCAAQMDRADSWERVARKLADDLDDTRTQLAQALQLLRRYEYLRAGATTRLDDDDRWAFVCPCCGWPKDGHDGPGRIKGNATNTHEEGCSLLALLHGEHAPRLTECRDAAPLSPSKALADFRALTEQTK